MILILWYISSPFICYPLTVFKSVAFKLPNLYHFILPLTNLSPKEIMQLRLHKAIEYAQNKIDNDSFNKVIEKESESP